MRCHWEIVAVGGGGTTVDREDHPALIKALEKHKITVWVGGSIGILDDWGKPVEKNVKSITRRDYQNGTTEVLYERPKRKKLNA